MTTPVTPTGSASTTVTVRSGARCCGTTAVTEGALDAAFTARYGPSLADPRGDLTPLHRALDGATALALTTGTRPGPAREVTRRAMAGAGSRPRTVSAPRRCV